MSMNIPPKNISDVLNDLVQDYESFHRMCRLKPFVLCFLPSDKQQKYLRLLDEYKSESLESDKAQIITTLVNLGGQM